MASGIAIVVPGHLSQATQITNNAAEQNTDQCIRQAFRKMLGHENFDLVDIGDVAAITVYAGAVTTSSTTVFTVASDIATATIATANNPKLWVGANIKVTPGAGGSSFTGRVHSATFSSPNTTITMEGASVPHGSWTPDDSDVIELVGVRSLSDTQGGRYPNAPYHTFIYTHWQTSQLIDSTKSTNMLSALADQWKVDASFDYIAVHHYVYGYRMPAGESFNRWPDNVNGAGMAGSGSSTINSAWTLAKITANGITTRFYVWTQGAKKTAIPSSVTPIVYKDGDATELYAWSFRGARTDGPNWHFWQGAITSGNYPEQTNWPMFVLWVLHHLINVRGVLSRINKVRVWVDFDDLCRQIGAWAIPFEGSPSHAPQDANILAFALATQRAKLGPIRFAIEAVATSLAASPKALAAIKACASQYGSLIHAHSHDVAGNIIDPATVSSVSQGETMWAEEETNLLAVGVKPDKYYKTMPANYSSDPWETACYNKGNRMLRHGIYAAAGANEQRNNPQMISAKKIAETEGLIYLTGRYRDGTGVFVAPASATYTGAVTKVDVQTVTVASDVSASFAVGDYMTVTPNGSSARTGTIQSISVSGGVTTIRIDQPNISGSWSPHASDTLKRISYSWGQIATYQSWSNAEEAKGRTLQGAIRYILMGTDSAHSSGVIQYGTQEMYATIIFHPCAIISTDGNAPPGIDLMTWFADWNSILPFCEGCNEYQKAVTVGCV